MPGAREAEVGLCRWPISAVGLHNPFRGFGCCTTLGHLRAEGEAEPVFPYRSLCVGKVFLCTLFGWFFFLMFSLVLLPI